MAAGLLVVAWGLVTCGWLAGVFGSCHAMRSVAVPGHTPTLTQVAFWNLHGSIGFLIGGAATYAYSFRCGPQRRAACTGRADCCCHSVCTCHSVHSPCCMCGTASGCHHPPHLSDTQPLHTRVGRLQLDATAVDQWLRRHGRCCVVPAGSAGGAAGAGQPPPPLTPLLAAPPSAGEQQSAALDSAGGADGAR